MILNKALSVALGTTGACLALGLAASAQQAAPAQQTGGQISPIRPPATVNAS